MIRFIKYLFLLLAGASLAQNGVTSNDWIDYGQSYYKLPILQTGIYRITYNELIDGGVPVTTINPQNLQVFGRGEEQYLYINGESDRKLDPGDYIEFFAEGNDGWLDRMLYANPNDQGNPYYSMFTDTIYFYLTWNNKTTNKRYEINLDSDYSSYAPVSYVLEEKIISGTNSFKGGQMTFFNRPVPEYSSGEGWGFSDFKHKEQYDFDFQLTNVEGAGPDATITVGVAGRSNHTHHTALVYQGAVLDRKVSTQYDMVSYSNAVFSSSLSNSQSFSIVSEATSFKSVWHLCMRKLVSQQN